MYFSRKNRKFLASSNKKKVMIYCFKYNFEEKNPGFANEFVFVSGWFVLKYQKCSTFWEEMNNVLNNKDSIDYCELENSTYY